MWLIDDEPTLHEFIRVTYGKGCGMQVVTFYNGADELQAYLADLTPAQVPVFILLDDMMPLLSGYEVLRDWLRPHPLLKETPIILFTARAILNDYTALREAGMTDYLINPTLPAEFLRVAKRYGGVDCSQRR
jgi:CheY-like chemotaxis protein